MIKRREHILHRSIGVQKKAYVRLFFFSLRCFFFKRGGVQVTRNNTWIGRHGRFVHFLFFLIVMCYATSFPPKKRGESMHNTDDDEENEKIAMRAIYLGFLFFEGGSSNLPPHLLE